MITSNLIESDPEKVSGMPVFFGTRVPINVSVRDDVQVQRVELLVDGEVLQSDVSFPWDLSAVALPADPNAKLSPGVYLLKVGKRKFTRVTVT